MFYTYFSRAGNNVLYRGYDKDGRRITQTIQHKPYLYVKDDSGKSNSLFGYPVAEKRFNSITEAKTFASDYGKAFNIHGNTAYEYDCIHRMHPEELEVDISKLRIAIIDIETETESGFPNIEDPNEVVQLVTFIDFNTKEKVTYGIHPSKRPNYVHCASEAALLQSVIAYIIDNDVDIISGWNSVYFDGAYLFGRIEKILSSSALSRLSPFGRVYRKVDNLMGREQVRYDIVGRIQLDMLDLYKKYRFMNRPRYKLGYIAQVEIDDTKKEYDGTFREHYTNDWESFVEYNQHDAVLVERLEDKLGLIYLAITLAYKTKVNYDDVYSPIKLWENYIKHSLLNENIFCPITKEPQVDRNIVGGYVADPIPNIYGYSVAFDATSLYPKIITSLNMSPETLIDYIEGIDDEVCLKGVRIPEKYANGKYAMAANGAIFSKEKIGIMAKLTDQTFKQRSAAKKKMLSAKTRKEVLKEELTKRQSGSEPSKDYAALSLDQLRKEIDACDKEASFQGVLQLALKVTLNSLFGAAGNKFFMFFDNRIAEGITMTGRFAVRSVNRRLDEYMKENFNPNKLYSIYADTDSTYLLVDDLVKKLPASSPQKIADAIDKYVKIKLDPVLQETTDKISKQLSFYSNDLQFKREAISSSGFWMAPKKYSLKVIDNEGVRYAEPEYKVTGIETNRSSTPDVVRGWLMECIVAILDGKPVEHVREMIQKYEVTFMALEPHEIAFPRSANNLREYSSKSTIYRKDVACPIAVRASLLHNHLIDKFQLVSKYQKINEGDKIRFLYLTVPNTMRMGENVIAFMDKLPPEFKLDEYVDYKLQFRKVFLDPLTKIMEAVKWSVEEENDISIFA